MTDKFKEFLSGSPYWMDSATVEAWVLTVVEKLPAVIQKWYDADYTDPWSKGKDYHALARKQLSGNGTFKTSCADYGTILMALKYLVQFFDNEMLKAGRGKSTIKSHLSPVAPVKPAEPVLPQVEVLEEGELKALHIAKHERNPALRKACIEYFRSKEGGRVVCSACGLVFGEMYGEIGDGYIEVHHLSPISQIEGVHTVDPKVDLVPLCANCHAMIHRLMAAAKKNVGADLEGAAALEKLRGVIMEHRQHD